MQPELRSFSRMESTRWTVCLSMWNVDTICDAVWLVARCGSLTVRTPLERRDATFAPFRVPDFDAVAFRFALVPTRFARARRVPPIRAILLPRLHGLPSQCALPPPFEALPPAD